MKLLSEGRSLVAPEGCGRELAGLYRSFHCASLNCMVAVISCIQDMEKIYDRCKAVGALSPVVCP